MDCNLKRNRQNCNCTYEPCSRKGRCCECIEYHRRQAELPACYFTKEQEATFDRSITRFMRMLFPGRAGNQEPRSRT